MVILSLYDLDWVPLHLFHFSCSLFSSWNGDLCYLAHAASIVFLFSPLFISLYRYIDDNEVTNFKEIAKGGFGTVFEGWYQNMRVAVKQVNRMTNQELSNFKQELALMR